MVLKVKNLSVTAIDNHQRISIIKDISFEVKEGICLGILGESGSGKSMTCKALMGLLEEGFEVKGESLFKGQSVLELPEREKNKLRGQSVCMILQNPMTAFNPLFTIGYQIFETLKTHTDLSKAEMMAAVKEAFEKMNLNHAEELLKKYPHELSGGMLQRMMIAMVLALKPDLIIADEPTTAIDSLNQLEVIKEFKRMRQMTNASMIFITHDLSVMAQLADELIVMEKGEIIERGKTLEVIREPKEDYTKYLVGTRLKLLHQFKQALR